MKLGAEPKKVGILVALVAAAGVLFYSNLQSGGETEIPASTAPGAAERPGITPLPARVAATLGTSPGRRIARRDRGRGEEFRPRIGSERNEDRPDLTKIDPTLRFDLFAKVQAVERSGGVRNLFQFSAAPPPPPEATPKVKVTPKTPQQIAQEQAQKLAQAQAAQSVKPPPPPITLKFYGYSEAKGGAAKRAFFLDGEDIFVAAEGELIKRRYKVIRIGGNSVVMEDVEHKHQQTILIQQEQG